jgi:hypothetical protein
MLQVIPGVPELTNGFRVNKCDIWITIARGNIQYQSIMFWYLLNDKTNALACKAKEQLTQRPLLMSEVNLIQQMKSDCNRRKTIKQYQIWYLIMESSRICGVFGDPLRSS